MSGHHHGFLMQNCTVETIYNARKCTFCIKMFQNCLGVVHFHKFSLYLNTAVWGPYKFIVRSRSRISRNKNKQVKQSAGNHSIDNIVSRVLLAFAKWRRSGFAGRRPAMRCSGSAGRRRSSGRRRRSSECRRRLSFDECRIEVHRSSLVKLSANWWLYQLGR